MICTQCGILRLALYICSAKGVCWAEDVSHDTFERCIGANVRVTSAQVQEELMWQPQSRQKVRLGPLAEES